MGFSVFRACMTVLILLGLLALFILPSQHLTAFSEAADALLSRAEHSLIENRPDAADLCAAFSDAVRHEMPALERFLNHSDVDALDAASARAAAAAARGDRDTALDALTEAKAVLLRICGIELFSWNSLL